MKVSCQACGAKYTIADDKVRGRKVKIRCKSCGAPIVVDAASEAPPPPDAPAAPAAEAPAAAASAGAGKAEPWSVNLSDTDQRTMTTDEIVAGWKSGEVTSDAFVWKEGMGDWVAILECDELKPLLDSPSAGSDPSATPFGPTIVTAPTAATKGLPAARVSGGRARGGVDLFDAVEGGGEDEVATSAPAFPGMAGTQPYDDGKMTGARNENSVLFSLDALKGGLTAEPAAKKSAPSKAMKSAGSAAADALVASPQSLGSGGASPLFSLSADQALLTAPAPPDPPPRAAEAVAGAGGKAPNKLLIYGGAGVGMVLLLGIGVMLGRSGKDEAKDKGGDSAVASASATPEKKEAKEEKKEEAKTEEPKTEASASASAAPSASAAHKVATGPNTKKETTASPAGSATTAKTTTAPKEEPAPAAGTAPFSVSAAQVALTQAASSAAGCKKPDGPTGSGRVKVTFATSGRVTSAVVDGPPFAGTPVGGCVAGIFRKQHVPPYAGNPVTVSKSFSIK